MYLLHGYIFFFFLQPDSEETNEMVFCDACDICVHQACYGIQNIPAGSWLCHPCRKGISNSPCVLCPLSGGAMKRTKYVVVIICIQNWCYLLLFLLLKDILVLKSRVCFLCY